MEIILGLLALQYGVIQEDMFVALVVLALVSSILGGPMMRMFISQPRKWPLAELLDATGFLPNVEATTREDVIRELAQPAAQAAGLDPKMIVDAVLARERALSTGIGHELAVPHARLDGLKEPVLVLGHSRAGIDFDSPDGKPARLVFLLLFPREDPAVQLQITAQIARLFRDAEARSVVYETDSLDVIRAMIKTELSDGTHG
jgi:mannitol/fructose-specific phosphotransferase system IIA component (Ntr-type)